MRRSRVMLLVASSLVLITTVTYGGGLHLHAKVIGFEAEGDDSFTIVLEQVQQEAVPSLEAGGLMTVHLRYLQPAESSITKPHYLRGVNLLLDHYRSGEALEVGFAPSGASLLNEPNEAPNEFQAIGLLMVEQGALHFLLEGE